MAVHLAPGRLRIFSDEMDTDWPDFEDDAESDYVEGELPWPLEYIIEVWEQLTFEQKSDIIFRVTMHSMVADAGTTDDEGA